MIVQLHDDVIFRLPLPTRFWVVFCHHRRNVLMLYCTV